MSNTQFHSEPRILSNNNTDGCTFIDNFKFANGHQVPIFAISTTGAFNQLIGYAKFINRHYGEVYYRGITKLHDNVRPSIMRERTDGQTLDLLGLLGKIYAHQYLRQTLKLEDPKPGKGEWVKRENRRIARFNSYKAESVLQHYCGYTRFLDVVDNHWIALWMGLHDFASHGDHKGVYMKCTRRTLSTGDHIENQSLPDPTKIYVYILLLAMPGSYSITSGGIIESNEFVQVDLRKALPSIYLRPHAQHALVIRRRNKGNIYQTADYYDLASHVVGILRVRVDIADKWLGTGELLTKDNLFPSPALDQGYHRLLMNDIFNHPFDIKKYF